MEIAGIFYSDTGVSKLQAKVQLAQHNIYKTRIANIELLIGEEMGQRAG